MNKKGFAPILLILGAFMLLAMTGTSLYFSNKFIQPPSTKITDSKQVSDRTISIPTPSPTISEKKLNTSSLITSSPKPTPSQPLPKIDIDYSLPANLTYQNLSDWQNYDSQGVSISIPKSWNMKTVSVLGTITCGNISEWDPSEKPVRYIHASSADTSAEGFKTQSIQKLIDSQKQMNPDSKYSYWAIEQDISINGLKGKYIARYSPPDKLNKGSAWQFIYLQKGETILSINVLTWNDKYQNYKAEMQNIIASLR